MLKLFDSGAQRNQQIVGILNCDLIHNKPFKPPIKQQLLWFSFCSCYSFLHLLASVSCYILQRWEDSLGTEGTEGFSVNSVSSVWLKRKDRSLASYQTQALKYFSGQFDQQSELKSWAEAHSIFYPLLKKRYYSRTEPRARSGMRKG